MNKTIRNVVACAAILFTATACASKCTYEDFKEAFKEAETNFEKEVKEFEEVKVKGKIGGEKYNFSFKDDEEALKNLTIGQIAAFSSIAAFETKAATLVLAENKNVTYYKGNGFKIENDKETFKFDKYGQFTAYEDGDKNDFTLTYTYVKK